MSTFKRFIEEFKAPPPATKSMSVKPTKAKRLESVEKTKDVVSIGLRRDAGSSQSAAHRR
jgi:hypothetical protein